MPTVEDRARRIVAEHLDVDPGRVVTDASLEDDLGGDSLDGVELILACEEEFDLELTDDEAADVKTFGDVVVLVEKKLA